MRLMVGEFLFLKNKSWFIIKSLDWSIEFCFLFFKFFCPVGGFLLFDIFVCNKCKYWGEIKFNFWMYFEKIKIKGVSMGFIDLLF